MRADRPVARPETKRTMSQKRSKVKGEGAPRPRRAIAVAILAATALVIGGGVAAVVLVQSRDSVARADDRAESLNTVPIVLGTVSEQIQVAGELLFDRQRPVTAGLSGVVTGLPEVGAQVGAGGTLYSVNGRPVIVLLGALPAWRRFEEGMDGGADVQQLESNLLAMGYFDGDVDQNFTYSTAQAVRALQHATGQQQTGSLDLGSVVFADGDIRVAELTTDVGSQVGAGTEVLSVSSLVKIVQTDVKLDDQKLAVVGAVVSVTLPDGTSAKGTVTGVGVATERKQQGGDATTIVIPTKIALTDPAAATSFQRASVKVGFVSEQRDDVLTAPIEALTAFDDTRFGVEVPAKGGGTKRVPVTTGLFAAGRVEISGAGIAEGIEVVVPER